MDPTPIANFDHPTLQALIQARGWRQLSEHDRVGAAYAFVRDEIAFGYNARDDLPASQVLAQGYGQCNTKGNLLIALLRALDLSARAHLGRIDKALQRGAIPEWLYPLAPRRILHSWVEVQLQGHWISLEGFILDSAYLDALQARFSDHQGPFTGYGAATCDLQNPGVAWQGRDTWIQREGLVQDLGVFPDPDAGYAAHGTNLRGLRRWLYQRLLRHVMNARVRRIRTGR